MSLVGMSTPARRAGPFVLLTWACALQVAAAASGCVLDSSGALPGQPDAASDKMVEWVRQNGGEVNVAIRSVPGMGRGVYAPRAFSKGDVLARIPVEMLWAQHNSSTAEELTAHKLLADMAREDSPWRPYFDALPPPADVMTAIKVPQSFLPVIQHALTEWGIKNVQHRIQQLWEQRGQQHWDALGKGLLPDNITHAAALLRTRMFNFPPASVLIPVVDMANNDNDCLHTHVAESCDPEEGYQQWLIKKQVPLSPTAGSGIFGPAANSTSSSTNSSSSGSGSSGGVSGQCLVWRAEQPVAAGEAVCNNYGAGLQDRMVLEYGFLQSGRISDALHLMDRHTQDRQQWNVSFEGNLSATWAEIDRLALLLKQLQSGNAAAAAVQPDEVADPGGVYLGTLKEWRRQRIAAVATEIKRLYGATEVRRGGFERWLSDKVEGGAALVEETQRRVAEDACSCTAAPDAGGGCGVGGSVLTGVQVIAAGSSAAER